MLTPVCRHCRECFTQSYALVIFTNMHHTLPPLFFFWGTVLYMSVHCSLSRYFCSWRSIYWSGGLSTTETNTDHKATLLWDKCGHSIYKILLLYVRGVLRKFCLHLFDRWNINVRTGTPTSAGASRWHFSTLKTQWNLNIASTERMPVGK